MKDLVASYDTIVSIANFNFNDFLLGHYNTIVRYQVIKDLVASYDTIVSTIVSIAKHQFLILMIFCLDIMILYYSQH